MGMWFAKFAQRVAGIAGHVRTFIAALLVIVLWAVTGPIFGFSDTWQLVINTSTTIVTFLMVFLIQNTQNRDARAMQLKLDELIRATAEADDEIMRAEDETDEELVELKRRYDGLVEEHRQLRLRLNLPTRASNAGSPDTGGLPVPTEPGHRTPPA